MARIPTIALAVALILLVIPGTSLAQTAAEATVFTGVNVLPMDGTGRVLANHSVVVEGDRIARVAPARAVEVPDGATVVDGRGKYLLPGLAEMHAHIPGEDADPGLVEDILFLYLAGGVTTIRGMLGAPNQLELRERTARRDLLGPTVLVGAPSFRGQNTPDAATARRMVAEHRAAGYDFLKLHPGLSREVYDAIVEAAGEEGITWAGHISADVGLEHTLATRQSTIDHLDGYLEAATSDAIRRRLAAGEEVPLREQLASVTDGRIRQLAAETAAAGVWNVPTAYLWENFWSDARAEDLLERTREARFVPRSMRNGWVSAHQRRLESQAAAGIGRAERSAVVDVRRRVLRALAEAEAPLLLGSDAPQMFNVPGFSIHREIGVMRAAGVSAERILESGTSNVARYVAEELGGDAEFGSVREGYRADLLLVEADPRGYLGTLSHPAGVMVRGTWLPREELDRRLGALEARYAD
jgi:imidazolonepropionase-like amidohydrolase